MLDGRATASGGSGGLISRLGRLATSGALLVGAFVVLAQAETSAAAPPEPADPAVVRRIDEFLDAEMRDADIPGLAVAIVAGGKVVHARGFGIADGSGRPVTADTPFQLASMSKAFTAVAIMQLVEEGGVELDAPVERYLPWFRVGTRAQSARITVRHLLNQVSGIPAWATVANDPVDGDDPGALERRVRSLEGVALAAEPGERHLYGNVSYEILGLIVQVVSGRPFDEWVATRIYEPLGMVHSHVLAADAFADGASEGFYRWFGLRTAPFRTPYPRATGPAGVSFSSANDMARWALFHLGHLSASGVLRPDSLAQLHEPAVQYDERHWYGMGWVIRPLWEELDDPPESGPISEPVPDLVEHGGSWETARTYIGLVPERDWGIVVLANVNDQTMSTRYFYVELGLLSILSGTSPPAPRLFEPPLIRYGKQLLVILFLLQLVAIAWTAWVVRRARAGARPPRVAIVTGAVLALALDAVVLYLLLSVAPGWYGRSVDQIARSAPDVGPLMILMLVLAAAWGPIRTLVLLLAARRPRFGTARRP